MFLRVITWIASLVLYSVTFYLGFITVGLFVLIVLQAPWMALITGALGGLFAAWFVRGFMHDVDDAIDVGVRRVFDNPQGDATSPRQAPLPDTNPYDRLRRLSDLRKEGHLSADEYEAKRQEILREL